MTEHQDWKPLILNKKIKSDSQQQKEYKIVNKGTSNKQHYERDNLNKIADSNETNVVKTISLDLSRTIQQARMNKKWTQKELANKINEQQKVIADYESGHAIPNNHILGKLEKVLSVKLRGK